MADEKTKSKVPFEGLISEEAREHARAARSAWRKSVEGLFPAEFIRQRRTARREILLAVRSVIDTALDRIDSQ